MRVFWLFRRVRSIFRSSTEVSVSFGQRKVFNQVMAGLSSRLRGNGIGAGRRRSMSALNGTKNESPLAAGRREVKSFPAQLSRQYGRVTSSGFSWP